MDATKHEGDVIGIEDKQKWTAQELGVNSNVPLVDAATGRQQIIRKFEFAVSPFILQKIKQKKIPTPTRQELFNSHLQQMRTELWKDGLVPREDIPPSVVVGRKRYKIVLVCEPRLGVAVIERPKTLQDITKPK